LLLFVDFVVLFDPRTGPSFLPRGWPVFDEQNICSLTTVAHPPDANETRTECVVLMSSSLRVPPPPQATKRGFATRDAQLLLFVDFVVLFDPRTRPSFLPRGWPVFDEQNTCYRADGRTDPRRWQNRPV